MDNPFDMKVPEFDIKELAKEALTDPQVKQQVKEIMSDPETLNSFKDFFKGGRRKKGGSDPEKDDCPVCLEKLKGDKPIINVHKKPKDQPDKKDQKEGADKHYFHLKCATETNQRVGNNCPSCRQPMQYFESLVGNNNNNTRQGPSPAMARMIRQGAMINQNRRRLARLDPIANRRRDQERLRRAAELGVSPDQLPRLPGGGRKSRRKRKRKTKKTRRRTKRRRRKRKRRTRRKRRK